MNAMKSIVVGMLCLTAGMAGATAPEMSLSDYDHVFFVSTDGNDENSGTTLDAAVKTVAKGLELAKASVAEGTAAVVVTPGTYAISSALAFDKPVAMIGQCDAEGNRPTIDGNKTCLCANVTCDGVVIRNIRLYNGSHNKGGVVSMTAKGLIDNCIIDTGYSGGNQSGGCVYMSNGTISRSIVKKGQTVDGSGNGDGVYMDGDGCVLEHSLIVDNMSNRTGSKYGGGVYVNKGLVRNCTITGNTGNYAGGIYVAKGAKLVDSIVWGNTTTSDVSAGAPNWQMKDGAFVTNVCSPVAMGVTTGGRNLTTFPNFKDLEAGDYRLLPGSPCIDAGSLTYPDGTLDLAGNPRTRGAATDLGALESDPGEKAVGIDYSFTGNMPGDTLAFAVRTTGFGEGAIRAYWNFSDTYPTAEAHDAEGLEGTHALQAGIQSISLTVVSGGEEYRYQVKNGFTVYGLDLKVVNGNPNAKPPYDTWGNAASNIADAVALATEGTVITLSNGTHKLTKPIDFTKSFTVQGLTGDPTDVTIDGGKKCLCADIKSDGAVIRDVRLYNGSHNKGGVVSMTAKGLIDHCIVDTGYSGGNQSGGCVYMSNGTISRSIVKNGQTTDASGNGDGVYLDGDGCVLEHSLIVDNKSNRTGSKYGGVYVNRGLVRNCTIAGNTGNYAGGIYVGANGNVIDTIVWGNTTTSDVTDGAPNFQMAKDAKVTNCWSAVQFGTTVGNFKLSGDPGFVDAANGDYTLGAASKCKDAAWGEPTVAIDLAGSNRVQGAAMDLGCYEADPNVFAANFDFTQDGTLDVATNVFTLIVTPEGTDLSNTQVYWKFDGLVPTTEEHDATGICVTNVFGAGSHDVAVLVVYNGVALEPIVKTGLFKVYASLICLDASNTAGATKPWNSWENASTNINEIVPYLTDDSVVLVKPGTYPVEAKIELLKDIVFRGVAADGQSAPTADERPCLTKKSKGGYNCFRIATKKSRVEHFTIMGFKTSPAGGAVRIDAGTLSDCMISESSVNINTRGGGVALYGPDAVMMRCVIANCNTTQSSSDYHGGGVYVGDGRVENCIVRDCESNGAGGVCVSGGVFVNCIVTNCKAVVNSGALNTKHPGGVFADGGTVVNCAIYGNISGVAGVGGQVSGAESRYRNNAMDFVYGSNCVTNDPRFADAAHGDWHIGKDSPLVNAGVNIDYTADSVDFEGNPRIFKFGLKSSKPDIGIYETPWGSPGMLLMVR